MRECRVEKRVSKNGTQTGYVSKINYVTFGYGDIYVSNEWSV